MEQKKQVAEGHIWYDIIRVQHEICKIMYYLDTYMLYSKIVIYGKDRNFQILIIFGMEGGDWDEGGAYR